MSTLLRLAVFAGLIFVGYHAIVEIMARNPLPPDTDPMIPKILWGLSLLFLILLAAGIANALFHRD